MRGRYLEVTFRKGRAIAAYLYLPRRGAERAARVSKATPGLLIDYNANGKAIGIEITAPGKLSRAALNRVLPPLGQPQLGPKELAPLMAAGAPGRRGAKGRPPRGDRPRAGPHRRPGIRARGRAAPGP